MRTLLALVLSLSVCIMSDAWAEPKIRPESVKYPLRRTQLYASKKAFESVFNRSRTFETVFGVRRWLHFIPQEQELLETTLNESEEWLNRWGSYGVLGHGEEMFTLEAARWRRQVDTMR